VTLKESARAADWIPCRHSCWNSMSPVCFSLVIYVTMTSSIFIVQISYAKNSPSLYSWHKKQHNDCIIRVWSMMVIKVLHTCIIQSTLVPTVSHHQLAQNWRKWKFTNWYRYAGYGKQFWGAKVTDSSLNFQDMQH